MVLDESILEQIGGYIADPINREQLEAPVRDKAKHDEFLRKFPIDALASLTLDQYCLGGIHGRDSFSWWIERGLENGFGRYSPGSARGFLIYRKSDGSYYLHRRLSTLSPPDAMKYVAKVIKTIASVTSIQSAIAFDSEAALCAAAGVDDRAVGGAARRLRLHMVYHPEAFIPISSTSHLDHYLRTFGASSSEIPEGAAAKMAMLWEVFEAVRARYNPRLTPNGFATTLYLPAFGLRPPARASRDDVGDDEGGGVEALGGQALNQVLYGPPGTGKTYSAIGLAVDIIDSAAGRDACADRAAVRQRFDELCQTGRIGVVTFHQSFSYEDFVEGIRATVDENQVLRYDIEDGLFKRMCLDATAMQQASVAGVDDISGRGVWKMSLGAAGSEEAIYEECIDKGYMLLGWGGATDVTGCRDKDQIRAALTRGGTDEDSFAAEALHRFKHGMKERDIVVATEGNHRFRAIGEIVGPYKYLGSLVDRRSYLQSRAVRWLRIYDPPLAREAIIERAFMQQSIYRLTLNAVEQRRLEALVVAGGDSSAKPYVLIVDEINRGNVARIFGELITLLEADKRWGAPEQLALRLPYSKKLFSVPANLYLIGTMNTADRSLTSLDHALRRRFEFIEVAPDTSLLSGINVDGIDIKAMLEAMNERIECLFDKDHAIGHAYFLKLREDPSLETLARIFESQVLPLLEEYFFEDLDRVRRVLADASKDLEDQFYLPRVTASVAVWQDSGGDDGSPAKRLFGLNRPALRSIGAYVGVYDNRIA